MLRDLDDYIGKYYSIEYIRKRVLHQTEEEIEDIDSQIKSEMNQGLIDSGEESEEEEEFS
jgi:hypothetical protein